MQRLEEVWMELPGKANRVQWGSLLNRARSEGDVWLIGSGPALRFLPGNEMRIEATVLTVASLETAKRVVSQSDLGSKLTLDSLELSPAKTSGLRFILREDRP